MRGVMAASIWWTGPAVYVAGSTSTNTGRAPARAMASAVLNHMNGTVMTSSPGPIPAPAVRSRGCQCRWPPRARASPQRNWQARPPIRQPPAQDAGRARDYPLHPGVDFALVPAVLLLEVDELHGCWRRRLGPGLKPRGPAMFGHEPARPARWAWRARSRRRG